MRKKLWAILMTIMMVATMMPTTALTAFAEGTGGDMGEGASDLIISGTKVWDDGDNPDRPKSIEVTLTQKDSEGNVVKTAKKEATEEGGWDYEFNITDW